MSVNTVRVVFVTKYGQFFPQKVQLINNGNGQLGIIRCLASKVITLTRMALVTYTLNGRFGNHYFNNYQGLLRTQPQVNIII